MLRTARRLAGERRVRVRTTFLGAHAVPAGLGADTYLDTVCLPAMRELASDGLIDAVDGFCETIAFSPQQIERVFKTALELRASNQASRRTAQRPWRKFTGGALRGRCRAITWNMRPRMISPP